MHFSSSRYALSKQLALIHTGCRIRNVSRHDVVRKHRRDTLPSIRFLDPFLQFFKIPRSLLRRIQFALRIPLQRIVIFFIVCHFGFSLYLPKENKSVRHSAWELSVKCSPIAPKFSPPSIGAHRRQDVTNWQMTIVAITD